MECGQDVESSGVCPGCGVEYGQAVECSVVRLGSEAVGWSVVRLWSVVMPWSVTRLWSGVRPWSGVW